MNERLVTLSESYSLPSKGLIYGAGAVNPEGRITSMTTMHEMERVSPSSRPAEKLASIIEDCMIEKPGISVYDMCIGDYEYLLQRLRVATYGSEYSFKVRCPRCGKIYEQSSDLDLFKPVEFDGTIEEDAYIVHLDKSNVDVRLKMSTPRILDNIQARTAEINKMSDGKIDYTLSVMICASIESINGRRPTTIELESFVNNLPMADTRRLTSRIKKFNSLIGLDRIVECKCPNCHNQFTTPFRDGPEFLGPEVD